MKKIIFLLIILTFSISPVWAEEHLSKKLSGKILLDVEEHGEAWYVSPANLNRYYLGRPDDAFNILKTLGVGISSTNLDKIPTGIIKSNELDTDNDGLSDNLEIALGTDPKKADTDNDGFNDKIEIENNYNPGGPGGLNIDYNFTQKNTGYIFIQTEKNGEAWYINPSDQKKYYLSRPKIAFEIMRQLGLGITKENLGKININEVIKKEPIIEEKNIDGKNVINDVANAIRNKDAEKAKLYFTPELRAGIEYFIENMPDDSILTLGNLMSGSELSESSKEELVYKNTVNFLDRASDVYFTLEKQENGEWLMTNL